MFIEENDISKAANGGTEISKRSLGARVDQELAKDFQIIPSRIRELQEKKIRVYWAHDLPEDPEVAKLNRDLFHKIVFSSNWQMNEFLLKLGHPWDDKNMVIETPLDPLDYQKKDFTDGVNLVYFSTPQRGLNLLFPIVDELSKHHKIKLHVFSSFKIYGWEDPPEYKSLFGDIAKHPHMVYHGAVDQETLRAFLVKDAHVLAYPCTWKETSCRVLFEAMSAGLMCVHPNLGALPDTSGGLTTMYQFNADPNIHAHMHYAYLAHAVQAVTSDQAQAYLRFVKEYADVRFDIRKTTDQWNGLMRDLLDKYPTIESRKFPIQQAMFHYKV